MLQYYEWSTNPPPVILSGGDLQQSPLFNDQTTTFTDQNHQFFHHHHHHHQPPSYNTPSFYDQQQQQSRPFFDPTQLLPSSMDHHQHQQPSSFFLVPKPEEAVEITARLGLNLGGRTYFSNSTEEYDFVNRLYRRSNRGHEANVPRCQAEDCNADLTHAKHYHRRHKVCEFHSKAATVVAAGLTQRFCQQCSRFHLLSEFDNGKRSCRKRLADHNRRRRKSNQQTNNNTQGQYSALKSYEEPAARISSPADQNITRESPPDSGAQPSSSVTVAASPPRMFLDCFKQKAPYEASLHASSNSLF